MNGSSGPETALAADNISDRLRVSAARWPERAAVIVARHRRGRRVRERSVTFAELERQAGMLCAGLQRLGVVPGRRIVLMVRPGIEFIALTFALFRSGATVVLIDPGMGRTNIFQCLEEVEPDGYVAIPVVHVIRRLNSRRAAFRSARANVVVGPAIPGLGTPLRRLLTAQSPSDAPTAEASPGKAGSHPAAIIFTSGSTGPPKGVVYEHGMFGAQVDLIQQQYGIQPGEIDLPGFPLFGLFNAAMGVTTVVPDMDPTRPALVDPERIIDAIRDYGVTQAFGSPAFWNRVGRHCEERQITLPTLRRALSAGGPVPNHVLERMSRILTGDGADLFTPYGATESLPVASIGAREALSTTAEETRRGAGTCVGRAFPSVEIRILPITDGPIAHIDDLPPLPPGEIGEIVVRGPAVTREYFQKPEATRLSKVDDPRPFPGDDRPSVWHRIGDVGALDDDGRLWFCGRKAHIVEAAAGRMHSVCCEAIFENHPRVYRAALVGLGPRGAQRPVLIAEPQAGEFPATPADETRLRNELLELGRSSGLTSSINTILFHPSLPVDTRHNVKIQREALAAWAAGRVEANDGPVAGPNV
ncbi:MAG: AMP-binding protein [Planctomyces sp.]|nr:AMP-binding protein [Planctomyces sp.]